MLRLRGELLEETFEHLRHCGAGARECVTYWLGPREAGGEVNEVVHPRHSATATSYDVDGRWLNALWLRLAREQLAIRAQVHTHPGPAYHSTRDDDMAAIQTAGFVSLVIPRFALGEVSLAGVHLARRGDDGAWRATSVGDEIEIS